MHPEASVGYSDSEVIDSPDEVAANPTLKWIMLLKVLTASCTVYLFINILKYSRELDFRLIHS